MWQNMPYGYGGYGGYGAMHGGGWLGFGLHSLVWILAIAAIIAIVVWAVRAGAGATSRHHAETKPRPTALEILDERYARGEIDREDYQARKADLEGG